MTRCICGGTDLHHPTCPAHHGGPMTQQLTHLERRALDIIKSGGNYYDIASQLAMSYHLVRKTVGSIVTKTGAQSDEDLLAVKL